MAGHSICPWWVGYILASPLRRLIQDPKSLLMPYVRPGMTVLEPGPGMGFFTLEIARLVGPSGRVIAADVQPRMIAALKRRARRAGLSDRIDARAVPPTSLAIDDLSGTVDFVLAFCVVHEMPAPGPFFAEAAGALKPGGTLLLVEPAGHVEDAEFAAEITAAERAGLSVVSRPPVRRSHSTLLKKPAE